MRRNITFLIFSACSLLLLASCGSTKQTTQINSSQTEIQHSVTSSKQLENVKPTYNIHYFASSNLTMPNDDINLDSTGDMLFTSEQKMQAGNWRNPKGMSKFEPEDMDTLQMILADGSIFTILSEDVSPNCPDGSFLSFWIERSNAPQPFILKTNTCAAEYNTLSGSARKQFKKLVTFFNGVRNRYRPKYSEKPK